MTKTRRISSTWAFVGRDGLSTVLKGALYQDIAMQYGGETPSILSKLQSVCYGHKELYEATLR